ncbi:type VII secretion protein EssB [Ureibacillus massiliensis]|uniref:type VII secretion protein EssB n=1 Tax=Ureibacillus massiliensis TaxID=292806 RepID=UPI000A0748E4|nr:type VII secretion protein EssB [Ureibacillus massiliensis]
MLEKKQSYLEKQLDATLKFQSEQITLTFQNEKVKLEDELEIALLREVNPFIQKEITLTEDELIFTYKKEPNFITFEKLRSFDEKSRWMFASNIVKSIIMHSSNRLHIFLCPENILIDESLTPYFLHYGVKESIPPYERDEKRLWQETRATIAAVVEPQFTFEQYIQFSKSIELSAMAENVMGAKDETELLDIIKKQLRVIEKQEKSFTKIKLTKWNWLRYSLFGLILVLLPLSIYTAYSAVILQPRQEAYIAVQGPFIQKNYSEIINKLTKYDVEDMPVVIQYELSLAYIVNETLMEEQRENVLKTITLQTDPRYYKYWIYIGRGQAEEALSLARQLEDLDYIMLALLHYEESVKANLKIEDEERERLLDNINTEKEEIQKQLEEIAETLEEEEGGNQKATSSVDENPSTDEIEADVNDDTPENTETEEKSVTEPVERPTTNSDENPVTESADNPVETSGNQTTNE